MNQAQIHMPRKRWKQWLSIGSVRWSLGFIGSLIILALLADLIANDLPLSCVYQGKKYYPAFNPDQIDTLTDPSRGTHLPVRLRNFPWKEATLSEVSWAIIPYGPNENTLHKKLSPMGRQSVRSKTQGQQTLNGRFRHHLGTTHNGRDVLAGIIHGTRISLTVGILAITIAAIIGIFMGACAGFWGDQGFVLSRGSTWSLILGIFFAWFYAVYVRRFSIIDAFEHGNASGLMAWGISLLIAIAILITAGMLGKSLNKIPILAKTVRIPLDTLIMRTIEILNSLPVLLLIITVSAIFSKSVWSVMLIIGFFSWTSIARLTRAELLKVRQLPYIEAGKAIGIPMVRLLFRHALPNALAPVWVAIALGIGQAIVVESSLSFLNLIDIEGVSWGLLMEGVKQSVSMWWVALFPGLVIFLTVLAFNVLGEKWRQVVNPTLSFTF